MTLKASYESKDEIPTEFAALFTEKDGVWLLTEVEGIKTQGDFDRFEAAMKKRLADQAAKFTNGSSGLSKDELRELFLEAAKELGVGGGNGTGGGTGSAGGGGDGKLHDLERRMSALETENKKLTGERDAARTEADGVKLTTQLERAALKAGAEPKALDMLVRLTRDDFELDSKGQAVVKLEPSVSGVTPNASPADYFKAIQTDEAFTRFWPSSSGGGAGGSGGGGGGSLGKENPFSKAGWNLTKQSQLIRSNRPEAERLAQIAGVKFGAVAPVK